MVYNWFYGIDLGIELFSIIILSVIIVSCMTYSRLGKRHEYSQLIAAFSILALSFVLKFIVHSIAYLNSDDGGFLSEIVSAHVQGSSAVIGWTIFAYRIMFLFALYLLYNVYTDGQNKLTHILFIYLLFGIAYLAHSSYYFFNITAIMILSAILIILNKKYGSKYDRKRLMLIFAFILLGISHIFFIFMCSHLAMYVAAEIVQLSAFILLLGAILTVKKDAKKG